jgi:murein DD-endopeptidase MepM/ murein hydrolase activator NlpD
MKLRTMLGIVGGKRRLRWLCTALFLFLLILAIGLLLPERMMIPVRGATTADWNHDTFWYYPWGKSVVHKGIDIFAAEGTGVLAATGGVIVKAGEASLGGNVVIILGPKWRLHYYAHLQEVHTRAGDLVGRGRQIATVGTTGNAAGKPPHLHYSIGTLIPYPWRVDSSRRGFLKMFILNPSERLLHERDVTQ